MFQRIPVFLYAIAAAFVISPVASFTFSPLSTKIDIGYHRRSGSLSPLGPTASNGLTYKDIQVGDGETVKSGNSISIHYAGSFPGRFGNKVEFENSRKTKVNKGMIGATEGMPIIFPVGKGKVIEGWEKGILGMRDEIAPMKVGGKRQLVIPAELAYGKDGRGVIPANQDLTFEVELISINIETESFLSKFFLYGVPGVFAFLILNSIYLIITGQA